MFFHRFGSAVSEEKQKSIFRREEKHFFTTKRTFVCWFIVSSVFLEFSERKKLSRRKRIFFHRTRSFRFVFLFALNEIRLLLAGFPSTSSHPEGLQNVESELMSRCWWETTDSFLHRSRLRVFLSFSVSRWLRNLFTRRTEWGAEREQNESQTQVASTRWSKRKIFYFFFLTLKNKPKKKKNRISSFFSLKPFLLVWYIC